MPTTAPEKPKSAEDTRSVIDMSKMNQGQRAALEITEAARESHDDLSFVAHLFMGRWRPDKLHPLTDVDLEEKARADQFLAQLGAFLREHVDPVAIDATGEIPDAVRTGLARLGAYGIKVPCEYGGLGFSQTTYCRACTLIGSYCSNIFAHLSVHQSVGVPQPLMLFGTEEQKKKFLPRVAGGELSAFALTEGGVGSDPARMTTRAEPDGDDFILNGEKIWISLSTVADQYLVMAYTDREKQKTRDHSGISAFIVERAWKGVEPYELHGKLGVRAGVTGGVVFRDVVARPNAARISSRQCTGGIAGTCRRSCCSKSTMLDLVIEGTQPLAEFV